MRNHYQQLQAEERAMIMLMRQQNSSVREIARVLSRAPSSISREVNRNLIATPAGYDPVLAGARAKCMQKVVRQHRKLAPDTPLFGVIDYFLRQQWSPEQIGGTLRRMYPDDPTKRASHETIYTALYAMPRGELRRDLIACLRQGNDLRRPRSRGDDRRGHLPDIQSIHLRSPEADDRLVPGHWEADLIKGAFNRSAVGTLVERSTRLLLLARMPDASAASALAGFSAALQRVTPSLRKTFTYDQGREMSRHRQLAQQTGVQVYFCDPHSPWQRGTNENTNGLLRQYFPKGTDLSRHPAEDLAAVAHALNTRPRKTLGWKTPAEALNDLLLSAPQGGVATTG